MTFSLDGELGIRLRAVSLFCWPVKQNAQDTQMTMCVTEGVRRPCLSRAWALLSINLKKKRDYLQSSQECVECTCTVFTLQSVVVDEILCLTIWKNLFFCTFT